MLRHSPFTEKLHTNYVPSDLEIDEIRSLIEGPLGELARLDTQIAEAQAFLDELRVKRQSLKAEIDSHTALAGHVRRLPQEILQEIFLACLPTQGDALPAVDAREAPPLLGLGLLRGSRTHPQRLPPDLSALTGLTIYTESNLEGLRFFRAHTLRRISLDIRVDLLGLPLVWGQLTDLTIGSHHILDGLDGLGLDGAAEVLSRCQNLVRADLHLWGYSRVTPRSALARAHLQNLTLVLDIPNSPVALLQFLSFPNLRQLAILHAEDPASDPRASQPTTPPSPASGTPHLSVDLSLWPFTQGTLLTLLALVPRVIHLRLRGTRETLDGGFLSRLTTALDLEGYLCPALTHLQISTYCVFSDAALLDFIRNRSRAIHAQGKRSGGVW
ncbi:hypothetical protein DFH09DRAFT_1420531 [Mycena vulgaris]|nr:hypothetical protein DFH09DRAFT_1420531 [Mycena vulgaris]